MTNEEWKAQQSAFAAFVAACAEIDNPALDGQTVVGKDKRTGRLLTRPYATLTSVLAAVQPPLRKHGLALLQRVEDESTKLPDGAVIRGLYLRTVCIHQDGGEVDGGRIPVRHKGEMKDLGGEIGYARRYAINAMFSLSAEGTGDQAPPQERPQQRQAPDRDPETKRQDSAPPPRRKLSTVQSCIRGAQNMAELEAAGRLARQLAPEDRDAAAELYTQRMRELKTRTTGKDKADHDAEDEARRAAAAAE